MVQTEHGWQTAPGQERRGQDRERKEEKRVWGEENTWEYKRPRGQVAHWLGSIGALKAEGAGEVQVLEKLRVVGGVRGAARSQDSL